jgi:hypothetical protein
MWRRVPELAKGLEDWHRSDSADDVALCEAIKLASK